MRILRIWVIAILLLISHQALAGEGGCYGPALNMAPSGPTITDATDTIPCGVIALDWGWTRAWPGGGANVDAFTTAIRFGLREDVELRWANDAPLIARDEFGRRSGLGDSYAGIKFHWREQTPRSPSLALRYTVKVPFASVIDGLGSGTYEHELGLLTGKDLGHVHFDFAVLETIGSVYKNGPILPATRVALALYRPFTKRWTGLVEGYTTPSHRERPEASGAIVGSQLMLNASTYVYTAVDFGLTDGSHRKRLLIGISFTPLNLRTLRRTQ